MATIQTAINLYDGMSPTLRSMSNALNTLINTFETMQNVSARPIDTSSIDAAKNAFGTVDDVANNDSKNVGNVSNNIGSVNVDTSSVASARNDIEAINNAVDGIEKNVGNVNIDTSGVNTVANDINTVNGAIDSVERNIGNVNIDTSGIASAINEVGTVNNAVDSIERNIGNVSINTSSVSAAKNNINTVNGAIDKIDRNVGQVNIDTSDIPPTITQIRTVNNAIDSVERNVGRVTFDMTVFNEMLRMLSSINTRFDEMFGKIKKNTDEQEKHENAIDNSAEAANKLKSILATIGIGMGIKEVLNLSDSLSQTTARLNTIVDKESDVKELQDKIFASAERSRGSYLDMADTVAKLSQRTGDLFNNNEAILFAENLNKMFAIAGASQEEAKSASLQLTQAMGSGVLRGEELNAIFESAPNLIQTIADYIQKNEQVARQMADAVGVSYESMSTNAMMHIRSLAEEGQLTSGLIKNAMLGATDDINKQFENMPYTWAQVWTTVSNVLLNAFQPALQVIGSAANWIGQNWSSIEPIFWGLAAAVSYCAIVYGGYIAITKISALIQGIAAAASALHAGQTLAEAAATKTATGAQAGFNAALLANPITWIVIAIAAVIAAIVIWINKIGGLKVAWLTVVNAVLTAWDALKIGFFTGVYWVQNLWDKLSLALKSAGTSIANFMGDMKVNVLTILQNMINSAIDIINGFINALNKIPGVSISAIEKVTFATQAKMENEAAKQARNDDLANYRKEIEANAADRDAKLNQMKTDAANDAADRQAKIDAAKNAAKEKDSANEMSSLYEGINNNTAATAENTDSMSDSMGGLEDSLEYMVDVAEREAINRFTTAEINVTQTNNNNINSGMDIDGVMERWNTDFTEILDTAAEGVHE